MKVWTSGTGMLTQYLLVMKAFNTVIRTSPSHNDMQHSITKTSLRCDDIQLCVTLSQELYECKRKCLAQFKQGVRHKQHVVTSTGQSFSKQFKRETSSQYIMGSLKSFLCCVASDILKFGSLHHLDEENSRYFNFPIYL